MIKFKLTNSKSTFNKGIIKGLIVSPCTIEIKPNNNSTLSEGQRVLVYRSTNREIMNYHGRSIGRKERIIGIGKVYFKDKKVFVDLPLRISSKPRKPIIRARRSYEKIFLSAKPETSSVHIGSEVLLKPIEE